MRGGLAVCTGFVGDRCHVRSLLANGNACQVFAGSCVDRLTCVTDITI